MNAKRRKEIEKIIASLEYAMERIPMLFEEESEAYENLPESIQESEKGEKMLAASEALESAVDSLSELENIIDSLKEASEN